MRRAPTPLSVLGELLLSAGAVVLLFVVWQLVWTDVVAGATARERTAAAADRFAAAAAERERVPGDVPGHVPGDEPGDGPEDGQRRDAAGSLDGAVASGQAAASSPVAVPEPGSTFALVHVPRFGSGWSVAAAEGTDRGVLDQGVLGHYRATSLPGLPGSQGNVALAGHRTTYGAPLARIDELVAGDPIVVETVSGWSTYRVSGNEVVTPDRVDVIAPVPGQPGATPTRSVLTLTACHPRYSARLRWVVHAELVDERAREQGPPAVLADPPLERAA